MFEVGKAGKSHSNKQTLTFQQRAAIALRALDVSHALNYRGH